MCDLLLVELVSDKWSRAVPASAAVASIAAPKSKTGAWRRESDPPIGISLNGDQPNSQTLLINAASLSWVNKNKQQWAAVRQHTVRESNKERQSSCRRNHGKETSTACKEGREGRMDSHAPRGVTTGHVIGTTSVLYGGTASQTCQSNLRLFSTHDEGSTCAQRPVQDKLVMVYRAGLTSPLSGLSSFACG